MTPADALLRSIEAGIVLWVEGPRLRYRAPVGTLTPALRDHLTSARGALIALLRAGAGLPVARSSWAEPWRSAFEERAALMEFEGGLPREAAEREAEHLVRLEQARAFASRHALVVTPVAAAVATGTSGEGPTR